MRKFYPKIAAILLGIVFLVGGATNAFGANSYFFQFNQKAGLLHGAAGPVQVAGPFADLTSCQNAQQIKNSDSSLQVDFCHIGTTATAEQQAASAQTIANNNQAVIAANATGNTTTDPILKKLTCNVLNGALNTKGTLAECIPIGIYYIIFKPASWLLTGSGYIFDAMLTLSIDSNFINQSFINSTWGVVRDFSNMLFIFILLFAGVQTILGAKDWRGTVLKVIVMALLINFSLFFTKVVIDAGNILAVGVYSSMGTPKSYGDQSFQSAGTVPERDISGSLAGAFQPQQFLQVSGEVEALDATIVFLIAAVVSGFAGYIFFRAALLFVRRLVVFWALMILSPFAFISIALPGKANKFQEWLNELIAQSFVVPVFLFLVYIIMKAISAGDGILGSILKNPTGTGGAFTFDKILMPVMIAALLIKALELAIDFAEGMAGSTGDSFSKLVGGAMGLAGGAALGVATGGTSLAGRAIGGRIAQNLQERGTFQRMATDENSSALGRFAGRQLLGLNEKARTGTWDVRGTSIAKETLGKGAAAFGVKMGSPSPDAKGGFEGAMKRQDQADLKFAKKLEMTPQEKEQIETSSSEKIKEVEKTIIEKRETARIATEKVAAATAGIETFSMNNGGQLDPGLSSILEAAKKEEEEAEKALSLAEETKKTVKTAKELIDEEEKNRRESYAKYIEERGKIIGTTAGATGLAGAVAGGAIAGPLGAGLGYVAGIGAKAGTYSNEQAHRTAEKLRKGGDASKPEGKNKVEELVEKMVADRLKEEKGAGSH